MNEQEELNEFLNSIKLIKSKIRVIEKRITEGRDLRIHEEIFLKKLFLYKDKILEEE